MRVLFLNIIGEVPKKAVIFLANNCVVLPDDGGAAALPPKVLVRINVWHCLPRILRVLPCRLIVWHCYCVVVAVLVDLVLVVVAVAVVLFLEKATVEHGPPLTFGAAHYFTFVPMLETAVSHSSAPQLLEHSSW